MKRLSFFSLLFLFVFGLSAGVMIGFNDTARAGDYEECVLDCITRVVCTLDTHPSCTNPLRPYAAYLIPVCTGGPLNCPVIWEFVGCWNGVIGSRCRPLPVE